MPEDYQQNSGKFRNKMVFSQSSRKYGKTEEYSNNTFPKKFQNFREVRKKICFLKIIIMIFTHSGIIIYQYAV